jgi:integrase/recombinase XerC
MKALESRPACHLSPRLDSRHLVQAFLSGRRPSTINAYRRDLRDFVQFIELPSIEAAAEHLLSSHGRANATALAYRARLLDQQLASATINRRLAALRSLVKLARTLGLVPWHLEVPGVKSTPHRDTRGPGRAGVRLLLDELAARTDAKGKRDAAAIRLLFDLALRRGELVALDLADVDLESGTLAVVGKGRTEKSKLTLPPKTAEVLAAWIAARGAEPGPLFLSFDRASKPRRRLTATGLYLVLRALGNRAGIRARPHGLRHAAITEALDRTGGDLRSVARFSRHADVRTVSIYDDARRDLAGKVAALVSEGV